MVDFHSHILPGIDDGAVDVETSAKMLELSKSQGVNTIVATPHFYAHKQSLSEFLKTRQRSYENVMEYAASENLDIPDIILGAEVLFVEELFKKDIKKLCIGNTNTILIELPFTYFNEWIYNEIYNISMRYELDIVLAHIERYIKKRSDFSKVKPFFEMDTYIQVNADSFIDRRYKKTVKKIMKDYRIDILGSDSHNLDSRVSHMDKANAYIAKKYGDQTMMRMMKNAYNILNK